MPEIAGSGAGGNLPPNLNQMLTQVSQLPVTSADAKKGLADLQQLTDQVQDKGYVSQGDIKKLVYDAEVLSPNLSPPQQSLISTFINELHSIPPSTGGQPNLPIGGGNAFLNCSCILALFMLTSKIIGLESKIQLQENLYKAKLGLAMVATAKEAYNASIAQGQLEANQYTAEAMKATVDAGLSLAQVGLSVCTAVASYAMEGNAENKTLEEKQNAAIDEDVDVQVSRDIEAAINKNSTNNEGPPLTEEQKTKIRKEVMSDPNMQLQAKQRQRVAITNEEAEAQKKTPKTPLTDEQKADIRKKAMEKYSKDDPKVDAIKKRVLNRKDMQQLTPQEKQQAEQHAQIAISAMNSTTSGIIQALKSTNEAALDTTKAKLSIQIAQQKATSELLGQLMNLLSQSASMLSNAAENDMAKAIQSQLELFQSAVRTFGEIGAR